MCDTPNPKPSPSGKHLDKDTWEALKASGFSDQELHEDQPFGPIIFAYTRKQAIEDGVLVDLTRPGFRRILQKCGIRVHAAMTATCFAAVIVRELSERTAWEALCRTAAVLTKFRETALAKPDTSRVDFHIEGVDGQDVAMYAHIGPGDQGEPVLTFMLEGED
jgi:hypothetical protein